MPQANKTRAERESARYFRRENRAPGRDKKLDPDRIDELLEGTFSANPVERAQSAGELCPCHVRHNVPAVWNRVLELAHDSDVRVRKTVLHMLTDGSPREREAEVVAAIETMFHDPDVKLRRHVRKFLAAYRRIGKVNIG